MCACEIFLKLTPCFLSYVFNSLIFNYHLQYICTIILTELVFSIWHYCIILIFIFVHSWNLLLFPLHFFFFFLYTFFPFFLQKAYWEWEKKCQDQNQTSPKRTFGLWLSTDFLVFICSMNNPS